MARDSLAKRVREERAKDLAVGELQRINAQIISIKIISQTPKRIEAKAILKYKEKRINSLGQTSSETSIPNLPVTYILGREKDIWQLVDYISGS